jgi:putative DNA primase/helicase
MLVAALDYAERLAWRVFPVAADGRSPMVKRGCHAASADPEQVSRWWSAHPAANIGLATGPDSGVLALDLDRKGEVDGLAQLEELQAEFGALPETLRSTTPSNGVHLLFRFPIGVSPANRVGLKRYAEDATRTVYPGIDVRAAGGSIRLPPSRKGDGCYAWASEPAVAALAPVPRWLLALMLSEPPVRLRAGPLRLSSADRAARYVCSAVDRECGAVASTPANTGRNLRLFQAAANLGELVGAGLLPQGVAESALEGAAYECGLVREDGLGAVRASIASGMNRGIAKPREVAL